MVHQRDYYEDASLFASEVVKRLDVIIKLLLESKPDTAKERTAREQIQKLWKLGLTPSEIGRIMGLPTPHVSAQLSQIKKKKEAKPRQK